MNNDVGMYDDAFRLMTCKHMRAICTMKADLKFHANCCQWRQFG